MSEQTYLDRALVRAVQAGEPKAFEAFYARFEASIYQTALGMTHDPLAAEEIVCDTFLRAHMAREQLDPQRSPLPWLQRVTTNLALNRLRRRRFHLEPLDALLAHPDPEAALSPELASEQREDALALMRAIRRLPPELRAAVVLRYVHEQTVPQIAELLGWPASTVKHRLRRALAVLRAELREADREGAPAPGLLARPDREVPVA